MKNKKFGELLIIVAGCLWGTCGFFVRNLDSSGLSTMKIVLARELFTMLILAVVILVKDYKLFKVRLRDLPYFAMAGIFSIVMFNYCYYKTISLSTLSIAAVLLYTAPFFVIIISTILFREGLTVKKCAACIIAFLGCGFVTGAFCSGQSISGKCLVFGLLTGFGYSLYTIFGNILLKKGYDTLTVTFYVFAFAFLGCLPFVNIAESFTILFSSVSTLGFAFGMGLVNTVLPFVFYTIGLQSVESSKAPIITTIEPVTATVLGAVLYGEELTVNGIIGIILVIGSFVVLSVNFKRKNS